jgi:hypothetical protein
MKTYILKKTDKVTCGEKLAEFKIPSDIILNDQIVVRLIGAVETFLGTEIDVFMRSDRSSKEVHKDQILNLEFGAFYMIVKNLGEHKRKLLGYVTCNYKTDNYVYFLYGINNYYKFYEEKED